MYCNVDFTDHLLLWLLRVLRQVQSKRLTDYSKNFEKSIVPTTSNMVFTCTVTLSYWLISSQSVNQYFYNAPRYRGACYSADSAEKRNVWSRVLNVSTVGAVRQFRGWEFQSLGAATEKQLGLHRSSAPARIRRFFQIRQKSGSGQNSARAGCYCRMLKMRTSNANSIYRTKIPGVSHRSLFCLHSTDV